MTLCLIHVVNNVTFNVSVFPLAHFPVFTYVALLAAETQPPSSDHSQHAGRLKRPHPVQCQTHWPLQLQERPSQSKTA